jgi:hypothetical protein
LSNSFSKNYSTSRVINRNRLSKNVFEIFPRANRKYLPEDNQTKALTIFGENLYSTIGYPKFTSIIRYITSIPPQMEGFIIGLLLSDAWLQINKTGATR